MEPQGSLPCSQEPATGPYSVPEEFSQPPTVSQRSILTLSSCLYLGLLSALFPSGFSPKFYMHFLCPVCATCPTHHILLNLITLIIFSEAYTLYTISLLQSPATSSLSGPNYSLQYPTFEHPQSMLFPSNILHTYKTHAFQKVYCTPTWLILWSTVHRACYDFCLTLCH
jgi:hypothetical protein